MFIAATAAVHGQNNQTRIEERLWELERAQGQVHNQINRWIESIRSDAKGMKIAGCTAANGQTFTDIEILKVTRYAVRFSHSGGETTLPAADCPDLWQMAFMFGDHYDSAAILSPESSEDSFAEANTGAELTAKLQTLANHAVVIIRGDQGSGSGFICKIGDGFYIYTAAHVLAGNTTLEIINSNGVSFTDFAYLEVAKELDLARLKLSTPVEHFFTLHDQQAAQLTVGKRLVALGNSGGAGSITHLTGQIQGLGAEVLEISANVIEGNSGGPVLLANTQTVIGAVSHGIQEEDNVFNRGTRFSEVRRFASRLDRDWEWQRTTTSNFLNESNTIEKFDQFTKVMFALSGLSPTTRGFALDTTVEGGPTIAAILKENEKSKLVQAVYKLNEESQNSRLNTSKSAMITKYVKLYRQALATSSRQQNQLNTAKFTDYHSRQFKQSQEWRQRADTALKNAVSAMN